MLDAPCSRIGHIYRKYAPFPNNAKGDFVGRVFQRLSSIYLLTINESILNRIRRITNVWQKFGWTSTKNICINDVLNTGIWKLEIFQLNWKSVNDSNANHSSGS